jgi:hypothetical protein
MWVLLLRGGTSALLPQAKAITLDNLQIEIVSHNPKTCLCLTSSQGVKTSLDIFELTALDAASKDRVVIDTFTGKELSQGSSFVEISDSVEGHIFILKVGMKESFR